MIFRHIVACETNSALSGFRLDTSGGDKFRENYDCLQVTKASIVDIKSLATPFNDDGGGNSIFLDRHHVGCDGTSVINSFRYVLHPNYFRGNRVSRYEYTVKNFIKRYT